MVRIFHPQLTYTSEDPPEPTSSYSSDSSASMYSKRAGTSGIRGSLYVTKLLSLLYFRAIHDDTIQEFQLATNIDKIGAFSDICFKAKVKDHDKPVTVFIEAKHRENKKQALKIDLATYFDSYMKMREKFGPGQRCDTFFRDIFNETECLFVIFTNANVECSDASATSGLSAKLNDILDMGGVVKQPYSEDNIEYLTKKTVKDQIISLAKWIVVFIYDNKNFQTMLSEELVLRYHVILAQKVVDVSDIQPLDAPRYCIARIRQDFFDNNEEYIMLFRDTLYLEVIKRRRIDPTESDLPVFLSEFLAEPTNATRLSKLIKYNVVKYKNGQVEFDKKCTKIFRLDIKPIDVSQSTVNKAVELAATEILSTLEFKVPAAFGNKDLTLSGSDAKIEKRICYLALKIKHLLDECVSSKIVTIDESLGNGLLQQNGGIAGAIGNIFVLDDNTNLMKITDNCDTLGTRAKILYTKLNSEVHNLHEYKFCFKVDRFPKLTFDCSHYEEKMARDFLNKILVYSNQAEENELQDILKNEIEDIQRNQPNYFQAKTDAIITRYYDEIQKWWMRPQHASYLTQKINLFRQLIDDIIQAPLMSSINLMYRRKIKQHDYIFTEDAVRSLNLQDQRSSTIIVAESCVLTVVKVLQHLNNKDHVVLDFEYIASLPRNDLNALRAELINTNKEKILILVCDKIDSKNEMKTLKNIAEAVQNKTSIIITDQKSLEILIIHKYFPGADKILHDKKFSLIDVCAKSRGRIIESATVIFPGVEIGLHHLLKGWLKTDLTSAGEADAAAASDEPTATGSLGIGMEHRGVVEQLKTLPIDLQSLSSPTESEKLLSIVEPIKKFSMETTFNGRSFYNVFKDAEFLKIDTNVQQLLAQRHELRKKLNAVPPGKFMVIEGMNLDRSTPLMIKKPGANTKLENWEFTYNRLVGLVAGYAYENRQRFPNIISSEAKALGLVWDQNDENKCKLYLSAVSGAEHFIDQFSFYPLLCGMRKYQLKNLPVELVVLMGNKKNVDGQTMAKVLRSNMVTAERLWLMFPGTSHGELQTLINDSLELKKLFHS